MTEVRSASNLPDVHHPHSGAAPDRWMQSHPLMGEVTVADRVGLSGDGEPGMSADHIGDEKPGDTAMDSVNSSSPAESGHTRWSDAIRKPASAGTVAVLVSQRGRIPMTRRGGAPICVIDRARPGPARWR